MQYLATFHTHFDAMKFARHWKKQNVTCEIKPVPRKVSSSCGSCVTFEESEQCDLQPFIQMNVESLYRIVNETYELEYKEEE